MVSATTILALSIDKAKSRKNHSQNKTKIKEFWFKSQEQTNIEKGYLIIKIITSLKSQIILAEYECSTNWGDCKSNKSNRISRSNK